MQLIVLLKYLVIRYKLTLRKVYLYIYVLTVIYVKCVSVNHNIFKCVEKFCINFNITYNFVICWQIVNCAALKPLLQLGYLLVVNLHDATIRYFNLTWNKCKLRRLICN